MILYSLSIEWSLSQHGAQGLLVMSSIYTSYFCVSKTSATYTDEVISLAIIETWLTRRRKGVAQGYLAQRHVGVIERTKGLLQVCNRSSHYDHHGALRH